ncbi:hypothetical protein D3C78_1040800 [compost metagenome]
MHPAGGQQLAHGRVDDWQAGARLFPGGQFVRCCAPGHGFGFRAKGLVPGDPWVAHQDVFVEFAPQQLVDPGHCANAATVEFALIRLQCGVQALPGRNHAGGEVGRQLAGAGFGRHVAFVLVVMDLCLGEKLKPSVRFVLACRPECAQLCARRLKARDLLGNRVAVDCHGGLSLGGRHQLGQRALQAGMTDFAELAVNLEPGAGLGQHTAWLEQQLIQVVMESHCAGVEGLADGRIPACLMNAVFFVDVDGLNVQLVAQCNQYPGGVVPAGGAADQQGNVQLAERLAQWPQVTQPEVHFARCIIVGQPLPGAQQVQRYTRAARRGGRESRVVMQAQVVAQPDQLQGRFRLGHLNESARKQHLVGRQGVFGEE